MDTRVSTTQTDLFLLRLWVEDLGQGHFEIRGQVKHVLTGETLYLREWPALLAFLEEKLRDNNKAMR